VWQCACGYARQARVGVSACVKPDGVLFGQLLVPVPRGNPRRVLLRRAQRVHHVLHHHRGRGQRHPGDEGHSHRRHVAARPGLADSGRKTPRAGLRAGRWVPGRQGGPVRAHHGVCCAHHGAQPAPVPRLLPRAWVEPTSVPRHPPDGHGVRLCGELHGADRRDAAGAGVVHRLLHGRQPMEGHLRDLARAPVQLPAAVPRHRRPRAAVQGRQPALHVRRWGCAVLRPPRGHRADVCRPGAPRRDLRALHEAACEVPAEPAEGRPLPARCGDGAADHAVHVPDPFLPQPADRPVREPVLQHAGPGPVGRGERLAAGEAFLLVRTAVRGGPDLHRDAHPSRGLHAELPHRSGGRPVCRRAAGAGLCWLAVLPEPCRVRRGGGRGDGVGGDADAVCCGDGLRGDGAGGAAAARHPRGRVLDHGWPALHAQRVRRAPRAAQAAVHGPHAESRRRRRRDDERLQGVLRCRHHADPRHSRPHQRVACRGPRADDGHVVPRVPPLRAAARRARPPCSARHGVPREPAEGVHAPAARAGRRPAADQHRRARRVDLLPPRRHRPPAAQRPRRQPPADRAARRAEQRRAPSAGPGGGRGGRLVDGQRHSLRHHDGDDRHVRGHDRHSGRPDGRRWRWRWR